MTHPESQMLNASGIAAAWQAFGEVVISTPGTVKRPDGSYDGAHCTGPTDFNSAITAAIRAYLHSQEAAGFVPCDGCDSHDCIGRCVYPAVASQEAAAPSEASIPWERQRVADAAKAANYAYQQWMPQQWIDLFIKAYEAKP